MVEVVAADRDERRRRRPAPSCGRPRGSARCARPPPAAARTPPAPPGRARRESLSQRQQQPDVDAARGRPLQRAQHAAIGDEVGVGEEDAPRALADRVQRRAPDREPIAQLAVRDHASGVVAGRRLARSSAPDRRRAHFFARRFQVRRKIASMAATAGPSTWTTASCQSPPPSSSDTHSFEMLRPPAKAIAAVAHQRLAVIAPQERPEARPPEAVPVIGDDVNAARPHAVEELGRRVAAADEVVEQPHLDAAARPPPISASANRRPMAVVAEDVHLQRDAHPRRRRWPPARPGTSRRRCGAA